MISKDVKKNFSIHKNSEKSQMNWKLKKVDYLIIYWITYNNFSALSLCKINVFDIFNIVGFFSNFFLMRNNEILFESNFHLRKYVLYLLK